MLSNSSNNVGRLATHGLSPVAGDLVYAEEQSEDGAKSEDVAMADTDGTDADGDEEMKVRVCLCVGAFVQNSAHVQLFSICVAFLNRLYCIACRVFSKFFLACVLFYDWQSSRKNTRPFIMQYAVLLPFDSTVVVCLRLQDGDKAAPKETENAKEKQNDKEAEDSGLAAVHVLTEEDVASAKYSIEDVVLPIPGHAVTHSDLTKAKCVICFSARFSFNMISKLGHLSLVPGCTHSRTKMLFRLSSRLRASCEEYLVSMRHTLTRRKRSTSTLFVFSDPFSFIMLETRKSLPHP